MARHELALAPRNDPLGFAQRAHENLQLIEGSYAKDDEGHVVTQLVLTLLAYIVFPKEKRYYATIENVQLAELEQQRRWRRPRQVIGTTETFGDLIRHMRNAVSHARVKFYGTGPQSSDSRKLEEISIEFSDAPPGKDKDGKEKPINWQIVIEGVGLRAFLNQLIQIPNNVPPVW